MSLHTDRACTRSNQTKEIIWKYQSVDIDQSQRECSIAFCEPNFRKDVDQIGVLCKDQKE